MSPLASLGFLACLILLISSGVAIWPAIQADRADHLLHKPGTCNECDQP